ncbi:hypothetical protein [Evansella cellulosilytica]|uniref:Flagellar hook-length control protein-like C-terminal domain-containing protein n=1 Tax=Evansella cellulosilytica (strain ATCC 21833 / DSM 2522 / FERM P-1141 / JCM 9156 / N-4) TaxID=649639 RepID=E6TXT7_EVAC2|nr:hypothetical protein [Evansella cellulosilytica]ADU30013.1 hypothetical protein Bcell_1750 [Evansella cellulosilytica DSM 2522]
MEVTGQLINIKTTNNDRPLQLREGGVYDAKIESRVSEREAVVSIRGHRVSATFSEGVPSGDRTNVQIEGKTEEGVRLREVQGQTEREGRRDHTSREQSVERLMRQSLDRPASPELRHAVQRLIQNNVPLPNESVKELNRFIEQGTGTREQRVQTVDTIVEKRLEPTRAHLTSVHEALHGKKVQERISEIDPKREQRTETRNVSRVDTQQVTDSRRTEASVDRQIQGERRDEPIVTRQSDERREVQPRVERSFQEQRVPNEQRQELTRSLEQLVQSNRAEWPANIREVQQAIERMEQEVRVNVNTGLREALQLQGIQQPELANERITQLIHQIQGQAVSTSVEQTVSIDRGQLQQFSSLIQNEANLQQALASIQNTITNAAIPREVEQILNQGMAEAIEKLEQGRELKARQLMIDTLQKAEVLLPSIPVSSQSDSRTEIQQYISNEILHSVDRASKQFLMTEVTERLATATDEFKAFKRDVTNQLTRIEQIIQQFRSQSVQQAKPMLENVIRQLDNALLKNDWLLFADMKTEKQVLEASSRLAEAKKLLMKGNHVEARQIVREVQQTLDKLNFKPNNQKVIHHATRELEWQENRPHAHRLSSQFENTVRTLTYNQGSGREVFEGLRSIGLNREAELGQLLASGKEIKEDQQRNMKSLLYQAAREEEGSRAQQQAQQSLQNLTGQQLLSRTDHQQNMQMLMFQIPMLLKDAVENLQVFVNSRNDGEKVDWENCSLYFLLDTKKMGEVGISLNVTDRALSVTIKNDSPNLKAKVEPLANKYLDRLKDIGFNVKGLQFSPMTEKRVEAPQIREEDHQQPTMSKEGFDYKV